MDRKMPMTPAGAAKLKDELKRLKSVDRPRIVDEIERARALGDLSENFEYHAAKNQQGLMEARIREIEDKLVRAEVIDPKSIKTHTIAFGATISIIDVETEIPVTYQIVGGEESDLKAGRISIDSPIAKQLIGKSVGDEVKIKVPGGVKTFEVAEIKYI